MPTRLLAQSFSYHFELNGVGLTCGLTVSLAVAAFISYLLSNDVAAIPPEHRREVTPAQAWLLLIPVFNLVWNFIFYPRVSASFASYFAATGRPKPGDYGRGLSLAYAITVACCVIPCVNLLALPTAVVLLIIVLVKFGGYKREVLAGGGGAFPVQPL